MYEWVVMDVGELIPVWLKDGLPDRLEWRSRHWLVSRRPMPWIDRMPWWVTAAVDGEVHLGEQAMWRVQAIDPSSGDVVLMDLAVEEPGWCRVTAVIE
ncbi:MAG: hypothetical protein LBV30_10540 [Propionibacteriaceae bacterium]|jgi:hypothetical protein|nr:hypothetical protein [Propionibacteriaceae bacterium]